MKYPPKQLEVLQAAINDLSKEIDVVITHPSQLHYLVYQQANEGQSHNWLYIKEDGSDVKRGHLLPDKTGYRKLINVPSSFELYPYGCNDSHIETAVKYCLKTL